MILQPSGYPNDGIYLLKLDNSGTTLFYKRLRRGYHLGEKVHVRQLPDSTYLAAGRNLLFWIGQNGDSLNTRELPLNLLFH